MNIKTLRKLAVKLSPTGTAVQISNPIKLYQNSFGFVLLQAYVPKTQNTTNAPLCTVYKVSTDTSGNRVQGTNYNLYLSGEVTLEDGYTYLVFENPMPAEFTDTVGDLEIVFNYADTDGEGNALTMLTTNTFTTTVTAGGWSNESVQLGATAKEITQIYDNEAEIAKLKNQLQEKVLTDFSVDGETGAGIKYYSDGTTATVQFPTGGSGGGTVNAAFKVLTFIESSWVLDHDTGEYELAFAPTATSFSDSQYGAILEMSDNQSFKTGQETEDTARSGYSQLADKVFKGSDGSLLIYGVAERFAGRVLVFNGEVNATSGLVKYNAVQNLTSAEKSRARTNIDAASQTDMGNKIVTSPTEPTTKTTNQLWLEEVI